MSVHFIGIGGAGMSSLARFALLQGIQVQGSDLHFSPVLNELKALGARIFMGHKAQQVHGAQQVIASAAIPSSNPELLEAKRLNIPIATRGQWLAHWVNQATVAVGVSGTHGKGTTAGALVAILQAARIPVSYILGAPLRESGLASYWDPNAEILVAEIDESDRSHHFDQPTHLLLTNLEVDHLHTYAHLDDLVQSFDHWIRHLQRLKTLVVGHYGPGVKALVQLWKHLDLPLLLTDLHQTDLGGPLHASFDRHGLRLSWKDWEIQSPLLGPLNAQNLLNAMVMARQLGVSREAIQRGVKHYEGLENRLHAHLKDHRWIWTDYTSHPTAMKGNLQTLQHLNNANIHVVFQPFRYSLLDFFWEDYIQVLTLGQCVHILAMDSAGESPIPDRNDLNLLQALKNLRHCCAYYPTLEALEMGLKQKVRKGDAIVFFGGGKLFDLAHHIQWSDRDQRPRVE